MARVELRLPENVPGDLYVDSSCIDCDTCRQIAPATFGTSSGHDTSYVGRQPADAEEERLALLALVACPTASIGSVSGASVREAAAAFPIPIAPDVPDILYCGYTSPDSFGASSYLIRRSQGNVLVDSPRAAGPLLARLKALGGVRTLFLTHRDDVADHRKLRQVFGCERILHADDRTADTSDAERFIEGSEPLRLDDELLIIPVPGHTRGSMALLYRDAYLFSGDHLWWSPEREGLSASRSACWYSWNEQARSMVRLIGHRFRWVLPGHGHRWRAPSEAAMAAELERLVATMGPRRG
jgi:glyoxylase-like metal-dependent hydrolase (beta-lactamase superfamily II)/ferredoxin